MSNVPITFIRKLSDMDEAIDQIINRVDAAVKHLTPAEFFGTADNNND